MTFSSLKDGQAFTWAERFPKHVIFVRRSEEKYQWLWAEPDDVMMTADPEAAVWRWGRFKDEVDAPKPL